MRKRFQIGAGLFFATALLCYPLYSVYFQLSVQQILGLFIGFGTFCYWYFDGRMDSVVKAVEEGLKGHIDEKGLSQSIAYVASTKKHWKRVRVLATSTGQIQPLFQSAGLEAEIVDIVVRRVLADDVSRSSRLSEFECDTERLLGEWRDLASTGRIRTLRVYKLAFFPLDYNVIFDDEVMIAGLLIPEASRFSEVQVAEPTLVVARTVAATREIRKHIERFDKLCLYAEGIATRD